MNKKLGSIIILSGPSGVGKSTLIKEIKKQIPNLKFSVSCTTREPRAGEKNNIDYRFISQEEFALKIKNNEFIEFAGVFANSYGTLKSEVIDFVKNGEDVFLDIDVQGTMQIQEALKKDKILENACEFIFIMPPSLEVLESRLRGRQSDSIEQINLRLSKAKEELAHWAKYEYIIINDEINSATQNLLNVIYSFKNKSKKF